MPASTRGNGLVRSPSKSCRFSPPYLRAQKALRRENFAVCGRRQGLLALDLDRFFEKLLHQKAFLFEYASTDVGRIRLKNGETV
jgi:hypothetical protein